jgi:hypothetical protein
MEEINGEERMGNIIYLSLINYVSALYWLRYVALCCVEEISPSDGRAWKSFLEATEEQVFCGLIWKRKVPSPPLPITIYNTIPSLNLVCVCVCCVSVVLCCVAGPLLPPSYDDFDQQASLDLLRSRLDGSQRGDPMGLGASGQMPGGAESRL